MPGFYNRDAQGRVIFQLTDKIVRLQGMITISASNKSGSLALTQMSGTPFFFLGFSGDTAGQSNQEYANMDIYLDGWTLRWASIAPGTTILYGVY